MDYIRDFFSSESCEFFNTKLNYIIIGAVVLFTVLFLVRKYIFGDKKIMSAVNKTASTVSDNAEIVGSTTGEVASEIGSDVAKDVKKGVKKAKSKSKSKAKKRKGKK